MCIMIFIYNILLLFVLIIFFPIIIYKIFTDKNLKIGIKERFCIYNKQFIDSLDSNKIIWIHASSVGEVNVSALLIKPLKKKLPDYKILITTMTVTGYENAGKNKIFDYVAFVPFDLSFIVKKFYKTVNPEIVLIAETEFWPNIFYFAKKSKIPLLVFNCRISDNSIKNYLKFKFFFKNILNYVDYFLCQNDETVERLEKLGVKGDKIFLSKNIKFDIDFQIQIDEVYKEFHIDRVKMQNIIVAGSTYTKEEGIILEVFENILAEFPKTFLIIAPRHPERANEVVSLCKNRFKYLLLSEMEKESSPQVLILDKIGFLIKAYSIASVCFVGGSLILRGGHNPLEAIYFKKPVISGPNIFNFKDIYKTLNENNGVIFVSSEYELEREIKKIFGNKEYAERVAENGYNILKENKGAVEKTIEYILKCLF